MSASGAIRAGSAYVELFLEENRVTRGLASLQARIRGWSTSLGRLGSNAYGGELPGPLAAIARFAASPAGMFAGLLEAAKLAADAGDSMVHLAEKAGTSVEAISALSYAARRADVDAAALAVGIRKMQVAIFNAAGGNKEAVEAMDALGLSALDLGRMLPEDQMRSIAGSIAAIQNPTERAALAVKIFGRNGTEMLPLLMKGSDGIAQMEARAKTLGIVLTTDAAEGAHEFSILLSDMHDVLMMAVKTIGGAMIPYMTTLTNNIIRAVSSVREWISEHRGLAVVLLQVTGAIVGGGMALTVLSVILRNAAGGIGLIISGISTLGSIVAGAGAMIATGMAAIGSVVTAVGAAFAGMTAMQIAAFSILGVAVVGGIGALLYYSGAVGNTVTGVAAAFRGLATDVMASFGAIGDALAAGDIALAAKVLWSMLKMEWQKGINWLNETWIGAKEIFMSTWTSAVYGLAGLLTNGWALVQQGWNGLVTGMIAAWAIFTDSVVNGWDSASNFVSKRWIDFMELIGQYSPDVAKGAKDILDQEYNAAKKAREKETELKLAETGKEFEGRKARIEADRAAATKTLDERQRAETEARQKQYSEDLQKSKDQVDASRKEWEAARSEAAKARADMNGRQLPGLNKQNFPDLSAVMSTAKSSVAGTFSGAALSGLGAGSSIEQKMEAHLAIISRKAAEQVVKADAQNASLERMERNMKAGIALA